MGLISISLRSPDKRVEGVLLVYCVNINGGAVCTRS